jgi:hypothetical protein
VAQITVLIREVSTGKEVDSLQDVEEKYLDNQNFYYDMGNGSCDCNRKLMFGQAQGIEFSDEDTPCGNTKYIVRVTNGNDIILDEFGS